MTHQTLGSLHLITANHFPVWLAMLPGEVPTSTLTTFQTPLLREIWRRHNKAVFRAVEYSRLAAVIGTGIDVEPTDAPISADEMDKALEYGGWPKVLIALNRSKLSRTWEEVRSDTDPARLQELRGRFPTECVSQDGDHIWFSRLAVTDPRLASPYESDYGYWIDGPATEAVSAVFILSFATNLGSSVEDFGIPA